MIPDTLAWGTTKVRTPGEEQAIIIIKEPIQDTATGYVKHRALPWSRITSYNVCYTKLLRIWRYTPSRNDYGLSGKWERFYQSPDNSSLVLQAMYPGMPQDVGYRNIKPCDCGGQERLYIASFGTPGRILYTDGYGVYEASTRGLNNGLLDMTDGTADLGYRAMACFKDRLWISPAGTFDDVDTADQNPVITSYSIHYTKLYDDLRRSNAPFTAKSKTS